MAPPSEVYTKEQSFYPDFAEFMQALQDPGNVDSKTKEQMMVSSSSAVRLLID
jgi:hypothetical protein